MDIESDILSLTNGLQQGDYYIGPRLPSVSASPVRNISEYLARKVDSNEFFTLKMLKFSSINGDSQEENQGKVLLHNEHSILSILQDTSGVIHHHGLFREPQKIILVLSCLYQHNYDNDGQYQDFVNLQQYVIQRKKLPEREALKLFLMLLKTVESIHDKNIVHRDLKLGNVVLNKRTQELTVVNFALSKHLVREDDMLNDQRGSLAYVSPDVLSGEPYIGKPSDMWSLGVLLYTMLYGQFPFYDNDPQELFKKIKAAKFSVPRDDQVSVETTFFLRQLMELEPRKRLTAGAAADSVTSILSRLSFHLMSEPMQIVPEVDTSQMSECLVPDQDKWLLNSHSPVNVIELTTPRLSLNPFINPDSHSSTYVIHSTPSSNPQSPLPSPNNPHLVFFPETSRNYPSSFSHINPFSCSPTSAIIGHTLAIPSMLPPMDSTQSLPTYIPTQAHHHILQTTSPDSPQFSQPSESSPTGSLQSYSHLHPQYNNGRRHSHSFSEGDPVNNPLLRNLLSPGSMHVVHGRRSLGSMLGAIRQQRRSSNHSPSRSFGMLGDELPRTRRRSHEPRDNEREILQSLQAAAHRNSIRSFGTGNI